MMREICVAETHEAAVRLARPYLEKKYQAYVQWGQHRALPSDDDMTQAFDDLVRDRFILGDPDECAAEIARCAEVTGATTMLFRIHWPGMPHEVITRAIRLLAEKVQPPRLMSANLPLAPAATLAHPSLLVSNRS